MTQEGAIIGLRVEGPSNSVDHRIEKLCTELNVLKNEFSILNQEQSNIFWEKTRQLQVFTSLKGSLLRVVVPVSETFEVIQKLKNYEINYFLDWGGSLIWLQIEEINTKILKEIKNIIQSATGYLTVIKIEEDMKATIDVFTVDPIKYKISEKIRPNILYEKVVNQDVRGRIYTMYIVYVHILRNILSLFIFNQGFKGGICRMDELCLLR